MQQQSSKSCRCGQQMFATGLRTNRGGRYATEGAWVCSNLSCRLVEPLPRWSDYWSARYQQTAPTH